MAPVIDTLRVPLQCFGDFKCNMSSSYRQVYTANSKKVVLRKSKIQITKYKIQEKVCHITHMSERLTSSL